MSGGGKGGSQTTTSQVEIPKWLEDEARRNISDARKIAEIGYVPYYGPDVAAFTPMQQAAFQNTGQAANAFGLANAAPFMPEPTTYAGGVQGYSSAPMFQQSLDALAANRPGQFGAINNMFIDPMTGQAQTPPQSQYGPVQAQQAAPIYETDPGAFAYTGGGGGQDIRGGGSMGGGK